MLDPSQQANFFSLDMQQWIYSNLANSSKLNDHVTWDICFALIVWSLWIDRNNSVFSQANTSSSEVIHRASYFMESCSYAMSSLDWISPKRSYRNILGCGGCFRDHTGRWLSGFTRRLGKCSINMAELWAIHIAIVLGRNANIPKLWIETDSNLAVTLITNGCSDRHPCGQLVQSIRSLIADHGQFVVSHTYRKANRSADALARLALSNQFGLYYLQDPPSHVFQLICDDVMGASFYRRAPI
ncbi:Ribonuclease H domain [Sesbania bispinosa]|nr:Ribonuclease H domain [Sesbania bispinosa]